MNNMTSSEQSFLRIIKSRNRLRFSAALLIVVAHAFFVGGVTFYRDWFAVSSDNSVITVGVWAAVLVIMVFLLVEVVYIFMIEKLHDSEGQSGVNDDG